MAKCKDCLHVELCANDDRLPGFSPEQEALCKAFLDRSSLVMPESKTMEFPRYRYTPKPQTNADRIRAMSDEELAAWMRHHGDCPTGEWYKCNGEGCLECWLDWLKQPVKDGEDDG